MRTKVRRSSMAISACLMSSGNLDPSKLPSNKWPSNLSSISTRLRKSAHSGALSVSGNESDQGRVEHKHVVAGPGTRQAGAACSVPSAVHAKERLIKVMMRTFRSMARVNDYDDSDMNPFFAYIPVFYNSAVRTGCVLSSSHTPPCDVVANRQPRFMKNIFILLSE